MGQPLSGIFRGESPLDALVLRVSVALPGGARGLERLDVRRAPAQALTREHAQLALCDVEPAGVLRCVVDIQTPGQLPGLLRRERLAGAKQSHGC